MKSVLQIFAVAHYAKERLAELDFEFGGDGCLAGNRDEHVEMAADFQNEFHAFLWILLHPVDEGVERIHEEVGLDAAFEEFAL